jgi:biotin transport system substrate-specific component
MNTPNLTLADYLLPSDRIWRLTLSLGLAVFGSLLLWVSAKIQVPFYPVPLTLQSLAVLGLAAAYGWRLGVATILLYLAEGALNLPVFAGTPEKGLGIAYMVGPTGGYLLGFVLAAALVGWLAQKGADRNPFRMFGAMLLGAILIYLPGIPWLATFVGIEKAVILGFTPFILGDLLKAALAAMLFPAAWLLLGRR